MPARLRPLAFLAALTVCAGAARADDKELADNPYYKYWSKSKVGASIELKETSKSPAKGDVPADEEVKVIRHKLVSLTPEKAVIETTVTEGEVFGFVESAPTKHIYPAKMSKEVLEELLHETGAKATDATIKVGDKELKVKLLTGTMKKGDEEIAFKLWLSEEVPGGIVRRVRTTKVKGELVAETTTEMMSFKKE
jgi:hypothetical protein